MRYPILLTAVMLFWISAPAQTSADEAKIHALLANQVVQWNRGNIEGYMIGYWESDSLVFIGKSGPTYGYRATLERYKKAYPNTDSMGKLISTVLRVRMLSPEWVYVTGRWELKRKTRDLAGYYTLLLRKLNGEWVIVEDHSS